MSSSNPDHKKTIICPNCGSEAKGNYCFQCGQPTHLHEDTLWGLILHFVEHYFHYDSKFWQTLKALWFKPGKLTLAYWDKKRNRYISPVSLYIFITALYFLAFYFTAPDEKQVVNVIAASRVANKEIISPSAQNSHTALKPGSYHEKFYRVVYSPEEMAVLIGKVMHNFNKIIFLMIPTMALLIYMLFSRRKELGFINHTIFSLHIHTFFFSVSTLATLLAIKATFYLLLFKKIVFVITAVYLILALRQAYKINWVRSVLYSATVLLGYVIIFYGIIISYCAILIYFM